MRKLLIIFLLFINSLFNFAYSQDINSNTENFYKNSHILNAYTNTNNIISIDFKGYENAILKLNQNHEEISAFLSQNSNKIYNPEYTNSKKYSKINQYKNFEKVLSVKPNGISSDLTSEICTRAP